MVKSGLNEIILHIYRTNDQGCFGFCWIQSEAFVSLVFPGTQSALKLGGLGAASTPGVFIVFQRS